MAATRLLQYQAGEDLTFTQKVQASILNAAQAISTELTSVANHPNRVALAKAVANNGPGYAIVFARMLAAQGTDNTASDAAIDGMVSSVWNAVAGVA